MKRFWAWMLAGVLAAGAIMLLNLALHWFPASASSPAASLFGLSLGSQAAAMAWHLLWAGVYGAAYGLVLEHVLPKDILPGGLALGLIVLLLAALAYPALEKSAFISQPKPLLLLALRSACFGLACVALGRQMEK